MYQGGKTILKRYGAYGAVVIFALVISFPVLRNGFVNYDDPSLVLEPAEKGKLDLKYWNMVEVFLPHPGASYTPIRTLTFVVCHAIGGEAPYIYHLASLFLYLLLCLAVYLFARCLLSWEEGSELPPAGYLARGNFWALLAAFVFTAHPLNVESLAWVSAVKDLFLALFTLACLLSFIYMEKGWEAGKKLTLVFFVLALVSKPSALMLPLVLAVYRWCRPSISMRLGLPRAFMISAVILISAYSIYLIPFLSFFEIYRHSGGPGSVISGALKVFFLYLKAFLLPLNLSVRYLVRVPLNLFDPQTIFYLFLFLFLILVAVLFWRRGSRLPAFALCWMVLTFLPTSGLLPLEILRADRYTLTSVPVFAVIVAASFRAIERNLPGRMGKALLFLCWLVPFFLTVLFVQRIDVWRSSETLWRDVLAREPEHRIAMHNLGVWYAEKGDTTKAVVYLQRALSLDPSSVKTMNSLGLLYEASGRPSEAEALFKEAAEQSFKKNESLLNLASLYLREGRTGQAEACLIEASAIMPQDARIHYQLSVCYQKESRLEKALDEMRKAYLIEPSNPVYQVGLGRLLVAKGDLNQGLDLFETALKRNETFLPAYLGLGELFSNSGKLADARAAYETALHREPQNLDALRGLASVIGRMGDLDSAAVILEHLIARNPEDCEALANMAAVYLSKGRLPEAVSKARLAIECDSTQVTNYLNIYTAYVYLDSLRAAEKIIAKALRIAPNSPQVIYARVSLSLKAGNQPDTTVYYLEKLLGMNIDSALRARIQTLTDSLKKSM